MLAWYAGALGLGNFDQAWVLAVGKDIVPCQPMCQGLGTLLGGKMSRLAHQPTGKLGFRILGWGTHVFPGAVTVD